MQIACTLNPDVQISVVFARLMSNTISSPSMICTIYLVINITGPYQQRKRTSMGIVNEVNVCLLVSLALRCESGTVTAIAWLSVCLYNLCMQLYFSNH